jgi:hypothetical protein
MSANNQVVIKKIEGQFFFFDVDMDSWKFGDPENKTPFHSLRHVIRAAQDYIQENSVEYGLYIDESAL